VDNRCGIDNSVAVGVCKQLHDGRVHPYFTCARNCSGIDQNHSRKKTCVNDL
jgi:hypothetical protein